MGTEIVFVLIFPVALICVLAAISFWFAVAKVGRSTALTRIRAYLPLIAGFAASMAGLALLTYIDGSADFTSLIQQGYYTEAQRAQYLPGRLVGQAIVSLVFVLPLICFVVIPMTVRLIRTSRLTLGGIVLRLVIGWATLSLLGWLWNITALVPSYPLIDFLRSTAIPTLIYGLPIPAAALSFFRRQREA